jgi:hypothetical protein
VPTLNNNWWGNTAENYDVKPSRISSNYGDNNAPVCDSWLYVDMVSDDEIAKGSTGTISLKTYSYDSTTGNTESFADFNTDEFALSTTVGKLLQDKVAIENGAAQFDLEGNEIGHAIVTAEYYGVNLTTEVDILQYGAFSELNNLVKNGGEINFDKNYRYDSVLDGDLKEITINVANTVINGNGFAVDGANTARLFKITADNVTVNNITFKNGKRSGEGAAIQLSSSNNIIANSTFVGNDGYAAVQLASSNNNLITNCEFNNNKGSYGGAICISASNNNQITQSIFTSNEASNNGGAITLMGASTSNSISNCVFTDNEAGFNAGAIAFVSVQKNNVSDSIFINNKASNNGGAIFGMMGENTIENCIFVGTVGSEAAKVRGAAYDESDANPYEYIGGIIGRVESSTTANLKNCFSLVKLYGSAAALVKKVSGTANCTDCIGVSLDKKVYKTKDAESAKLDEEGGVKKATIIEAVKTASGIDLTDYFTKAGL